MNKLMHSRKTISPLRQNPQHNFAMNHSMMLYRKNALYSFIPKNACSTLRLSTAVENGCISGIEEGNWIHTNNNTFNATLGEAIKIDYSFVVLRCPFKRLASVYLDKFVAKEPNAWQYRNLLNREINLDDLTFRDFVLSLKKGFIFNSDIHWRKQIQFLIYEEYSDYFCLEEFSIAIETLKSKIGFNVIDARKLTCHGTDSYSLVDNKCYADSPAFDIAIMKRQGRCPTHNSLYDQEIYEIVSNLYADDIALYKSKFSDKNLMHKPM